MIKGWWYFYLAVLVFAITFASVWLLFENIRVTEYISFAENLNNISKRVDGQCAIEFSIQAYSFCQRYRYMKMNVLPQQREVYDKICDQIENQTSSTIGNNYPFWMR